MKIIVDTNVVISGTFFKGKPRDIIIAIANNLFDVYASPEIIAEYKEIMDEMIERKQGTIDRNVLNYFISKLNIIETKSDVKICRDPDDNKFINCALDSKSLYIVSGDKDLLSIGKYKDIEITITISGIIVQARRYEVFLSIISAIIDI